MTDNQIVDYVEIVQDENGKYRVRARSNNGNIIWTTEQYGDHAWALAVATDSGKPLKTAEENVAQAEAEKINPHVWDSQWNRRVIAAEAERDRLQQALRQIEPVLNELIAWINTDISGCLEVEARGEAARLALRAALAKP